MYYYLSSFLLDTKSDTSDGNMGSAFSPALIWETLHMVREHMQSHAFVHQRDLLNQSSKS